MTVAAPFKLEIPIPRFDPVEPPAFREKRLAARKALAKLDPPSDKKYTNWLRQEIADRFADKAIGGVTPKLSIDQPDYDTGLKTIAIPLSKAIKDWPDQVLPYLQDALLDAEHYFAALSASLYTEGVAVVVPKNTKAEIVAEFAAEPGKLNAYRNIIIAGEGSEVTYTEINAANQAGQNNTLVIQGTEVYVAGGANLDYYNLQQWPENVSNFAAYRGRVDRDATLNWLIGSFGGRFSQLDVQSELAGAGATSNVKAVYYGDQSQHFDQTLTAFHKVGHTTSDTYARGIVTDSAKAVYRGMIRIAPGAHGSTADQNGHGMLLSDTAHADMIPGLEIDADDVVAGHGATIGQIDREQLFYLMARGLPEADARNLIIHGFFEQLFGKIKSEPVRARFWAAVKAKGI